MYEENKKISEYEDIIFKYLGWGYKDPLWGWKIKEIETNYSDTDNSDPKVFFKSKASILD